MVRGLPAELALGLRRAVGPPQRRGAHLADGEHRRAGQRLGRAGELQRRLERQLDRGRVDAGQPAEVGEQAVEREVPVAEDVALADLRRARPRAGGRARRPAASTTLSAPSTYAGIRRCRKRRTSSVEERWTSPLPITCAGLTITSGSPCAAIRSASFSASCLLLTYGRPKRPARNTCVSSAVAPRGAGPIAATDDVRTARSTPARSASSSTIRVPSTLTRKSVSAPARSDVRPATWKTRVTPRSARRIDARSSDVGADLLDVEPLELLDARPGADGDAHAVAALDEQARDVRADEAGRAGDQGDAHAREPSRGVSGGAAAGRARGDALGSGQCPQPRPSPSSPTPRTTSRESWCAERGIHVRSASTSTRAGSSRSESDMPDFDAFYDGLRTAARAADDLAAVDRRLPRGLRAAGRRPGTTSSRSTSPAGSPAPSSRRARRPPSSRRAAASAASRSSTRSALRRGLAMVVLAAAGGRRRRAPASSRSPSARARRSTDMEIWFSRRHARVPAARRADRPRAGLDRQRAERQADPVVLGRHAACRSSASARAAARSSGCSSTCARARPTARRPGSSSTSRRPTSPSKLVEGGREIFGNEPLFVSEVGPVLGTHAGPGHARRRRAPAEPAAVARR